ncbi:hypothetical protein [Sporosarcina ureae]|uniref:Uncharacterized protein n=1 Tax=Sporosarcina ureae TaxID=1571 RepID=A0ABN4YS51_SPOUR|nr:hypothetical protein [Sporosarcina ureae]ARF14697.1 hypothetical protein SporoS204_11405 [Sporosarcina ureae]
MKLKFMYFALVVFSIMLIMGCSNKQVIENSNDMDSYEDVKAAAWEFLKEEGWQDQARDDLQSAKVKEVIVDNKYILLDKAYDGKEVLSVSFEDVDNAVTGTPLILVDSNTNKVIAYMPTE